MEEIPGVLFLILVVITVNRKYDEMFDLYKNSLKLEGINYSFYSFEYKQPKKKYRIEIICTNKQKEFIVIRCIWPKKPSKDVNFLMWRKLQKHERIDAFAKNSSFIMKKNR